MKNPKKAKSNAVSAQTTALYKLYRKRRKLIKDVTEANAALEAHLQAWTGSSSPGPVGFDHESTAIDLAAAISIGDILEYELSIAVNNLFHFDDEVAGELNSVAIIRRFETRCARESGAASSLIARIAAAQNAGRHHKPDVSN